MTSSPVPPTSLKRDVLTVDGIYYDTEKLAAVHPGGPLMVRMCNGKDCTAIFVSYHRRRFPHSSYKHLQVEYEDVYPNCCIEQRTQPNFDAYLELCHRVQPIIAATKGFAPWNYYIKVFLWCALMIGIDLYSLFYWRPMYLTLLHSFAMAMVGLNVQHDANHGAVSLNWRVNRVLGLTQDLLGGGSISWIAHHDFIHHIYTNEPGRDVDIDIPLLRLHSRIPHHVGYCLQQFYVFFLEAAFGPVHVLTNIIYLLQGPTEQQRLLSDQWNVSRCMAAILPIRLIGSFVHAPSLMAGVVSFLLQYMLGGFYLSFFFLLSHNFDGAKKEGTSDGHCFLASQTETGCNFGGWWWAQLNGGLNFQIEHHLFPRVHHGYFPYIAPVVRDFCRSKGIHYTHFSTLQENVRSTYNHLKTFGGGVEKKVSE